MDALTDSDILPRQDLFHSQVLRIKPHFKALSDEFPAAVFITVDVDELDGLAGEYGIRAMPTFIFIKNGKKVADLLGADANKLKELVKQHH